MDSSPVVQWGSPAPVEDLHPVGEYKYCREGCDLVTPFFRQLRPSYLQGAIMSRIRFLGDASCRRCVRYLLARICLI